MAEPSTGAFVFGADPSVYVVSGFNVGIANGVDDKGQPAGSALVAALLCENGKTINIFFPPHTIKDFLRQMKTARDRL